MRKARFRLLTHPHKICTTTNSRKIMVERNAQSFFATKWSDAFIASYEEPYAPDMRRVTRTEAVYPFTDDDCFSQHRSFFQYD